LGGVNGLAIDSDAIYWLEYDINSGNGKIVKSNKDGGTVIILAEGFPSLEGGGTSTYNVYFPNGIALNDTHIFWGEEVGTGAIRKVSKNGGGVTDIRRGDGFKLTELEADNQFVYAINSNVSEILKINLSTETSTVLNNSSFSTSGAFSNLELANDVLYWSEITTIGKVFSLPILGGDVVTVKSGLTSPRSVYVRGSFLYVASSEGLLKIDLQLDTEEEIVCSNLSIPFTMNIDQSSVYISDLPLAGESGSKVLAVGS